MQSAIAVDVGRDEESPGRLAVWSPDGLGEMMSGYYNVAYAADGRGRGLLRSPAVSRKTNREAGVFDGGDYRVSFQEVRQGADLLIIDTLHLPPEELEKIVEATDVKTVVFTHLTERPIGFARYYDLDKTVSLAERHAGRVVVAQEGMELEL